MAWLITTGRVRREIRRVERPRSREEGSRERENECMEEETAEHLIQEGDHSQEVW